MRATFRNPIVPGFHPDPSICRVGGDYYLVTSTFEWFPGLPLLHSRDLVHWRLLGHVLDRPSQLPLDGIRASAGLYAPTIRHAAGTWYVICTLVDGLDRSGCFVVTADDPAGDWSEPHWLPDAPGIDPSLLFDDDGRVWCSGAHPAEQAAYPGHNQIWLQELDLDAMRLVGPRRSLWEGAVKGAAWAEAPHIYHLEGRYYLLISEGGTGHDHAVTVARSDAVTGPYEPNPRNPILTHRHLGLDHPIVGTGHADLVDTPSGQWWAVLLAMRPYGGYFYNLGRETFLAPVRWEEGWPVVSPGSGRVEATYPCPDLPEQPWPSEPACDQFESAALAPCWSFQRTPRERFWSLTERPGFLRLSLRPERLEDRANPSLVARRQQHVDFAARTALEFAPGGEHECAGLALVQSNDFHFRLVLTRQAGSLVASLVRRAGGVDEPLGTLALDARGPGAGRTWLKVEARGQAYGFFAATEPERWLPLAERVDGRVLSTPVAGGFVGTCIGMYASSNGRPSDRHADFDWFEYAGSDPGA
jgi:xylan 1,4-beta-xylosidase